MVATSTTKKENKRTTTKEETVLHYPFCVCYGAWRIIDRILTKCFQTSFLSLHRPPTLSQQFPAKTSPLWARWLSVAPQSLEGLRMTPRSSRVRSVSVCACCAYAPSHHLLHINFHYSCETKHSPGHPLPLRILLLTLWCTQRTPHTHNSRHYWH